MGTSPHHRFTRGDASRNAPPPMRILDRAGARALDQAAIEQLGMPGILLMEHAAQSVRLAATHMLRQNGLRRVVVVCGPGNNGGDGYALARLLAIDGIETHLVALSPPTNGTDAAINADIWSRSGHPIGGPGTLRKHLERPALLVDALFGIGLDRPIEGAAATLVELLNDAPSPILAVDVPSGLDADTGLPLGPCIQAAATVTFVAPKPAMLRMEAARYIGEYTIGDIGTPPQLLETHGQLATIPGGSDHRPDAPPPPPDRRGP